MPWLFDFHVYYSPRNGLIWCRRLFGQWAVFVDGIMQTSPYVTKMWDDALGRLPADRPVKEILLLGLGAGGVIPVLRRRFPGTVLTVVEWDPVMVTLAERLKFVTPAIAPAVVVGDAKEEVPRLAGRYDLVMFDLFTGSTPDRALSDENFIGQLRERLQDGGLLLVNAYRRPELLSLVGRLVAPVAQWQWQYNHLGFFRRGVPADAAPGNLTSTT